MTYQESLEWQKKEKEFLDTLDLRQYLVPNAEIKDIMDKIEEEHNDEYKLEEFIFNCMDRFEFIEYLEKRYEDIHFYQRTTTTFRVLDS